MPNANEIERKYGGELQKPSVEAMLVYLILQSSPSWNLSDYENTIDRYFNQRNKKNGLRLPRAFEAGILLHTAEQCRLEDENHKAQGLLSRAAECHPGHKPLREIEENFLPEQAIDWFQIVFPRSTDTDV